MIEIMQMVFPSLFFFLLAVFIFVYVMSKQKERMVLIEKGVDITKLNTKKYGRYANLRNGILIISLAIGLILGYIVTITTTMNVFIAYAVCLLLCEGIGFLIYYKINKNSDS